MCVCSSAQQHQWDTCRAHKQTEQSENNNTYRTAANVRQRSLSQKWNKIKCANEHDASRRSVWAADIRNTSDRPHSVPPKGLLLLLLLLFHLSLLCIQIIQQFNCAQIMRANKRGSTTDTRAPTHTHTHTLNYTYMFVYMYTNTNAKT